MAYAIMLLGLNLLFGYTGLVSFGHALFLGIGAYTGAFLTTHTPVRSLELILVVAMLSPPRWPRRSGPSACAT